MELSVRHEISMSLGDIVFTRKLGSRMIFIGSTALLFHLYFLHTRVDSNTSRKVSVGIDLLA